MKSLVDSMHIITCAGKNKTGKVVAEITSKGYCFIAFITLIFN